MYMYTNVTLLFDAIFIHVKYTNKIKMGQASNGNNVQQSPSLPIYV